MANGTPLLAISVVDERLSIDLSLYDENDALLVEVAANEWISGDPAVWDLWSSYQKLKLRTRKGDIRLGIDATVMPMQLRAVLMKNGKTVRISPSKITSDGPGGDLLIQDAAICGVNFDLDTRDGTITLQGGGTMDGAMMIEPDPKKRLAWGIAQMTQVVGD